MLIGNTGIFAFDVEPVAPSWELRYAPEAAAWAGLSLWVRGQNLCEHVREGEQGLRARFYVPLGPIADWLVRAFPAIRHEERAPWFPTQSRLHETVRWWGKARPPTDIEEDDWLTEREAFWSRHFLAAGADGARLPNLAVLRQEDVVALSWAPPRFASPPVIRLMQPEGLEQVPWRDFCDATEQFVSFVARQFREETKSRPFDWVERDPPIPPHGDWWEQVSLYCGRSTDVIASLFGVPAGALAHKLGLQAGTDPAASAACQVLRDMPPRLVADVGAEILSVVDQSRSVAGGRAPLWAAARAAATDAALAGPDPETQGQLAAEAVRTHAGLDGQAIGDLPELLDQVGLALQESSVSSSGVRMLAALASGGAPCARILATPRTSTIWGRRFEQARALGHALTDPLSEGAFGAASSPYAQHTRRRRSGAFAAELLLPAAALEKASGGKLDGAASPTVFAELLHTYGVGARTAAHQLFNRHWLSSASVRDELIDSFAYEKE
jgi:hypothetical protein